MTRTKERWCVVNQFLWVVDVRCVDLVLPLNMDSHPDHLAISDHVAPFIHVLLKQNMDTILC
jgi:hypothetical protein